MGGCTITRVAETLDPLFSDMKGQILAAARSGLWPDSELIIIDPSKDEGLIYKITVKFKDDGMLSEPIGVEFEKVEKGRAFHVGIASRYGPKPKAGQLVGTVHVHS